MDNERPTDEEAQTRFDVARIQCSAVPDRIIHTGIEDPYTLESFHSNAAFVIRDLVRYRRNDNQRINETSNNTYPTLIDYELKAKPNPLSGRFQNAWNRFERSR